MLSSLFCFFFNATATTEIYTLSLHDALPIWTSGMLKTRASSITSAVPEPSSFAASPRSEEHTSELQSLTNLVCRLLLEKKNKHVSKEPRPDHVNRETRA